MKKFTVLDLIDLDLEDHNALHVRCIGGRKGLIREITVPDLNRPGLALNGFFDNFAFQRIQLFGRGETAYLKKLEEENKSDMLAQMFTYQMPCCVFTHSLTPPVDFLQLAEDAGCPILQSSISSANFTVRVIWALSNIFAPQKTIHGVFVEVFGIGVLLLGDSGVGKSEAALELIERGHRLIADDAVEIKCISGNILMGTGSNKAIGHHMEIRGLGIINITHLFGVGAIRDTKRIQLVVQLEDWDSTKEYDRLGVQDSTIEILDVHIPFLKIPVKPGRNIPIIIETAAMNERLKKMGYYSAKEFNQNILKWLESENARNAYFRKNIVF
ncbi:MAG: HPr kinase/phosphorylase [Spirochaetales bacterium]|nr:MAG: HPr kinase/phosphorylase [Spirochaetales bacterium]